MDAPESGIGAELGFARTPLKVIGWVLFAFISLLALGVTWSGIDFAHAETCGYTPPTARRLEVTLGGLGIWLVLAAISLVLLLRGRAVGLMVAVGLEVVAGIVSFMTFVIPLFAAGMC